jgi:hypothetical protein
METIHDEIVAEISGIPDSELPDLVQLIRIFKATRQPKKNTFQRIARWRGGIKDIKSTSVELQHEISKIWSHQYVSD